MTNQKIIKYENDSWFFCKLSFDLPFQLFSYRGHIQSGNVVGNYSGGRVYCTDRIRSVKNRRRKKTLGSKRNKILLLDVLTILSIKCGHLFFHNDVKPSIVCKLYRQF
jgi:hypothetical protein